MRVKPGTLELAIQVFERLGCFVTYGRERHNHWVVVGQGGFDIQLREAGGFGFGVVDRTASHVAFTADHPDDVVADVWLLATLLGLKFVHGKWTDNELWFDLPEVFTDWVIEVMKPTT